MTKSSLKSASVDDLQAVAACFRALGEVSRLQLIRTLQGGEKNVTDLARATALSQPNVSRHLAVLVGVGLIGRRKDGTNVLYRVVDERLADICEAVCHSMARQLRGRRS